MVDETKKAEAVEIKALSQTELDAILSSENITVDLNKLNDEDRKIVEEEIIRRENAKPVAPAEEAPAEEAPKEVQKEEVDNSNLISIERDDAESPQITPEELDDLAAYWIKQVQSMSDDPNNPFNIPEGEEADGYAFRTDENSIRLRSTANGYTDYSISPDGKEKVSFNKEAGNGEFKAEDAHAMIVAADFLKFGKSKIGNATPEQMALIQLVQAKYKMDTGSEVEITNGVEFEKGSPHAEMLEKIKNGEKVSFSDINQVCGLEPVKYAPPAPEKMEQMIVEGKAEGPLTKEQYQEKIESIIPLAPKAPEINEPAELPAPSDVVEAVVEELTPEEAKIANQVFDKARFKDDYAEKTDPFLKDILRLEFNEKSGGIALPAPKQEIEHKVSEPKVLEHKTDEPQENKPEQDVEKNIDKELDNFFQKTEKSYEASQKADIKPAIKIEGPAIPLAPTPGKGDGQ